jgi:8-oxo-dGTP diphosphatase
MQGYNVLMVYNKDMDKLLMCERLKNPYKGLSNLVGGKIEIGETGIDTAYRELLEETNISNEDIILHHLMEFKYYLQNCYVEVYVGRLKRDVSVTGDENILYWFDLDNNSLICPYMQLKEILVI